MRISSHRQALIAFVDGSHAATASGGEITFHQSLPPLLEATLRQALQVSGTFRYQTSAAPINTPLKTSHLRY